MKEIIAVIVSVMGFVTCIVAGILGFYLLIGFMDWVVGDPWNIINNVI